MAVSVQDVVDEAPELRAFAETPAGAAFIAKKIVLAQDTLCPKKFGTRYDYAVALLAAHMVLASRPDIAGGGVVVGGGAVASATIDGVSVSYGATVQSRPAGTHSTTRPGQLLDDLIASVTPAFIYL